MTTPDELPMLPLFVDYDMSDPKQMFIPLLRSFPDPNDPTRRVPVPKPEKTIPAWGQDAWDLGYRHHPELMKKYPIPGDQPGMAWLNADKIVTREEYEKWLEDRARVSGNQAEVLLAQLDPQLAAKITTLTEEQRAELVKQQTPRMKAAVERLQAFLDAANEGSGSGAE